MSGDSEQPRGEAEFGPSGYLPERAARRARKIVLREPMALGWPLAAVVAAIIVLATGVAFLVAQSAPPGDPFRAVGQLAAVDPRGADVLPVDGAPVLVVRAGGGVRAYEVPAAGIVYCERSDRLESPGGQVWNLDGRLLGGPGSSLVPLAAQVHDGTLYVAPQGGIQAPAPADDASAEPACATVGDHGQ